VSLRAALHSSSEAPLWISAPPDDSSALPRCSRAAFAKRIIVDLVLDCEHVVERPVEALRPPVISVGDIHELNRDTKATRSGGRFPSRRERERA
jgi:hypothetical protein